MELQSKSQARKIGGSLYVKIDPYFVKRGLIRERDWVDMEIRNVERTTDTPKNIATNNHLWKEQQEPLPNLNKGNSRPSSLWDYRTMVKCAPLPIIDVMRFNDGTDEEVVFIEFA